MAKTARKRKSKQEQVSEELKLRIICLFFIFLVIIAAMQLGGIGDHLNYVFMYVFGNLNGIIYLTCILLLGYIVVKADFPKFNGPKAVGLYLLFIGLTLFISATPSLTGIKVIQSYFNQVPLNRGGLLGAVLYGFLSALFDYMGAIIAAVFIVVTGIILLGSKFYFEHKKEIQKRAKNNFNNNIYATPPLFFRKVPTARSSRPIPRQARIMIIALTSNRYVATKAMIIMEIYRIRFVFITFPARLMTTSKITAATPARITCSAVLIYGFVRNCS